jgi:hypothetical protein
MPKLSEHVTDQEREFAYRRGYLHGVHAAISGLVHLLPNDDKVKVEVWLANQLTPWEQDQSLGQFQAPDFPRLS